eukprot:scaffold13207_cov62-Phaeocystis_antarctica.AAC.4
MVLHLESPPSSGCSASVKSVSHSLSASAAREVCEAGDRELDAGGRAAGALAAEACLSAHVSRRDECVVASFVNGVDFSTKKTPFMGGVNSKERQESSREKTGSTTAGLRKRTSPQGHDHLPHMRAV